MTAAPLYDPRAFDLFLNDESNLQPHAIAALPETPMGQARRAQLRFAQGNPDEFGELAREMANLDAPLARGIHLSLMVALRDHTYVLSVNPEPQGFMPVDLEDSCLSHAALGMSAAQLGHHRLALEHLRTARTLARAVGLHNRGQQLEVEWHRVRNLVGEANPQEIELLLLQSMPDRRRAFGQRIHALSLMSLGRYNAALTALGTPGQDSPHDAGLREWLHAQCMLPPVRLPHDPIFLQDDPWVRLARTLRSLMNDRKPVIDVEGITYEPQATYARLLSAASLLRPDDLAQGKARKNLKKTPEETVALITLGEIAPDRPDQAVVWALLRISAQVRVRPDASLLDCVKTLEHALPRLGGSTEILNILKCAGPERYATLLMSPLAGLVDCSGLASQPFLLGRLVVCGAEEMRLMGRSGTMMVLEAADCPERSDLWRSEKKRLREVLVGFGGDRVVNMGILLRTYGLIARAAQRLDDERRAAAWADAARRAESMMSDEVQCALSMRRPQYLT